MRSHIFYIVNPKAGVGSKNSVLTAIDRFTDSSKYTWQVAETAYPGHGAVLATMAVENGADVVVAVGGDGTVNEIARSLAGTDCVLGIIPAGSGNGLARHLQIPLPPQQAIALINQGATARLDYGLANRHPFFCTCGLGFDATISYKFAQSLRRGAARYVEKILKEIIRYRPETYIIDSDDGELTLRAFLLTCANASQYGNNAYIAPAASLSDGLMDVTLIEPFTAIEAPQLALRLLDGRLRPGPRIKMFRSRSLTILRERKGVIHCDGDPILAGRHIRVCMVRGGLTAIINPAGGVAQMSLVRTVEEAFNLFLDRTVRDRNQR